MTDISNSESEKIIRDLQEKNLSLQARLAHLEKIFSEQQIQNEKNFRHLQKKITELTVSKNCDDENNFVIYNGVKTKMTYEQIFDFNSFTDLKFVAYKTSENFFDNFVTKFNRGIFIIGDKNSDLAILQDKNIKVYIAVNNNIHGNFFLLSNDETKRYRVIIGSTYFYRNAFSNFRVDDSKELYDLYLQRFEFLLSHTKKFSDYQIDPDAPLPDYAQLGEEK